jgi:hypothetical protein
MPSFERKDETAPRADTARRFSGGADSTMKLIYKIAPAFLWRKAQDKGRFAGALVDITDGYIHFSTAEQAEATAANYFSGKAICRSMPWSGQNLCLSGRTAAMISRAFWGTVQAEP